MRVIVFDYGAGNLHSLLKAVASPGIEVHLEDDPRCVLGGDLLLLPGVGAFAPAAERLAPAREAIRQSVRAGLPVLGVCLGMQLLFDESEEGHGTGLGLIPGRVERLQARRLPHIGWNTLEHCAKTVPTADGIAVAYFAHSYACRPLDTSCVQAWCAHEHDRFPAVVRRNNVLGVQFHPEKSSHQGVMFLRAVVQELGS